MKVSKTGPVVVGLALWACSKQEPPPASPVSPPEQRQPAPAPEGGCLVGAPCTVGDLSLTVTAIEDSRCPINARCIQAGTAMVSLSLGELAITLHTNPEAGSASAPLGDGRSLILVSVDPFPGRDGAHTPPQAALRIESPKPTTLPY